MAAKDPPPGRRALLRMLALPACATTTLWLGGCTTPAPPGTAATEWHDVPLPGKRRTEYHWEVFDGQRVIKANAQASASMYRRRLAKPRRELGQIEFAWWAHALPQGGDVATADATDAAARVLLAFGGDPARLSQRNQMSFELARTLTGEAPPFATLAYVWDVDAPVESLVVHPRSDRMRKIVVESGPQGLRQWRRYRRSIVADYRRAFGEAPGPLLAVAVMTDGDNTRSSLITRYASIELG